VTEVFIIKKHKKDKEPNNPKFADFPNIFFSVEQAKARGKDQEDWYFEITDKESWGVPREIGVEVQPTSEEEREIRNIDTVFSFYTWTRFGATYTELHRWFESKGMTSNRRIDYMMNEALEHGIIYKEKKKYYYKGLNKPLPIENESMPFGEPEDDVPF
jgi:hypothetical protein